MKARIKTTPLIFPYVYLKSKVTAPKPQNDEGLVISRLLYRYKVPPSFVELGFSGWEFNCAGLVGSWRGLLIDGDIYNTMIANTIMPASITARHLWVTLETISVVEDWLGSNELGILSIDVDGNDYWFLERLILSRPSIIVAEYNSSFGLKPLTVPYDPAFNRLTKHESHTYFGASLTALHYLAARHGYSLIEIGNTGINAFFVRNGLLTEHDIRLNPQFCFREKLFPDGSRPSQQWERMKHLPFVDVTEM